MNINRLFVLSFRKGNNDPPRNSFDKHYMPLAEIKDFFAPIDNKPFVDKHVKNKQEAYEKIAEMSRNNDCATENVLYYLYQHIYYKVIGIHLSRQTNSTIPQKIYFTGKLQENDGTTMFYITEKQQKIILNLSLDH